MATEVECSPDNKSFFLYRKVKKPSSALKNGFSRHAPLQPGSNDIRLVAVVPRLSEDGFVQCEIAESSIDIGYTCLSYVWGDTKDMWRIKVNGRITWVRRSPFDFLITAMRTHNNRFFWIDVLCINQLDLEERNQQVQKMGQIYSKTEEVFA